MYNDLLAEHYNVIPLSEFKSLVAIIDATGPKGQEVESSISRPFFLPRFGLITNGKLIRVSNHMAKNKFYSPPSPLS